MHTKIEDGKPVVSCCPEELPTYIVWADYRDMSFDSSEGPIDHTDPTRVQPDRDTLVGFQFSRRPTVLYKVDGVADDVLVRGYPMWTSPYYFLDSEVMDIDTFKAFAKEQLPSNRYEALEHQLDFQNAHEWPGILVTWIDRERGMWRQQRYELDMVALNQSRQVVTTMRTKDGERPLPTA